jgi:twinkle protein
MDLITGGEFRALKGEEFFNRGIDKDVCEKFGVKCTEDKMILPYYSAEGNYSAQKYRKKDHEGKGCWAGDPNDAKTFFGSHLWSNGRVLTITEGEFDALAAYQMFGKKYPCVSLRNGADKTGVGPAKEIETNYEYLRGFDKIVLCFDNDEPGRTSAEACAKKLPIGKCQIMHMNKHKDANEYLSNNAQEQFISEFWQSKPIMPQDLVFGTELGPRIIQKLYDRKERSQVRYPWENLNKLTYGIRLGEMVTVISGTGCGKSTVVGELMYHILSGTQEKLGMFMLEESVEMANLRLASIHAGKPYHLPDTEWTEDELGQVFQETIFLRNDADEPRVVAFDHFGSNTIDEMLFRVDHMVALGCKYIFLDHISIIVSDQQHGDERKALDEIATKLRTKVQEHDIALFVVSHLRRNNSKPHEEGGQTSLQDIRGTQAIAQLSDMVLGLERNGQAEDPYERNVTRIRVLKNRLAGLTGLGANLYYDIDTGRLNEIEESEEHEEDSP